MLHRLLPLIVEGRVGRAAAYAQLGSAGRLLERCWSVAADRPLEENTLGLEVERLGEEFTGALTVGTSPLRVQPPAADRLRDVIPAFRERAGHLLACVVADAGRPRGVLLVLEARRGLGLRARRGDAERALQAMGALLEGELAREEAQARELAELRARLAAADAELRRFTQRADELSTELGRARRALAASEPRIAALELAQAKATELLLDSHVALVRREERLRRYGGVLEALRQMLGRHASGAPPRELAAELVSVVSAAFDGSRCSLLLWDPSTRGREYLRVAAALGLPAHVDPRQVRVRMGEGISGWVASHGAELVVRDPEEAANLPVRSADDYTGAAFASFPLACHGRFTGVLNLTNFRAGTFDDAELEALRLVALTVALVVDHSRLNERLFALDPL